MALEVQFSISQRFQVLQDQPIESSRIDQVFQSFLRKLETSLIPLYEKTRVKKNALLLKSIKQLSTRDLERKIFVLKGKQDFYYHLTAGSVAAMVIYTGFISLFKREELEEWMPPLCFGGIMISGLIPRFQKWDDQNALELEYCKKERTIRESG